MGSSSGLGHQDLVVATDLPHASNVRLIGDAVTTGGLRAISTRSARPRSTKSCVVPTGSLTLRCIRFGHCVPQMCHSISSLLIVERLTFQKEKAQFERSRGRAEVCPSSVGERAPSRTRG